MVVSLKNRLKDKPFTVVQCVYLAFLLFSAIYWLVNFHLTSFLLSIGYMFFVPLVYLVEGLLKIRLGSLFTCLLYLIPIGSILGSCFNFYMIIPFLDLVLHCLSGVVFACVGVTLAQVFFGDNKTSKNFFGCLLFGVFFSLAIAMLWEIFEYALTFLGFDMMEDSIINGFESYLLSGTHSQTTAIDGITKTVIHYGQGQVYTVNGYLDIGLVDTLGDMIICSIGAVVFMLVAIISRYKVPIINQTLIPKYLGKEQK